MPAGRDDPPSGRPPAAGPRRRRIAVLVGCVLGATVVTGVLGLLDIAGVTDGLQWVDVPGSTTVTLTPGEQTVVMQYRSNRPAPDIRERPQVTVADPSGAPITLRPAADTTVSHRKYLRRIALGTFRAEREGTYTVRTSRSSVPGVQLAIGNGDAGFTPYWLITVGALAGSLVALGVGRRRRQSDPPTGADGTVPFRRSDPRLP